MATIKEVAKLANVSIGTVSNVLNGKTENEQLISRVEKAMEELSYHPDANARNLKNTKSQLIGVIVPNIIQPEFSEFIKEVEEYLLKKGYSILLKFSQNNNLIEKKSVSRCIEQSVDGIILYSMTRKKPYSSLARVSVPSVLISRRNLPDFMGDRIVIDYSEAFDKALKKFYDKGLSDVGLIMEYDLLDDGKLLDIYNKYFKKNNLENNNLVNSDLEKNYSIKNDLIKNDLVKIVDCNKERGFQAFFELYLSNPNIKGIVAGSYLIAQGIKKAMDMLGLKDISIVVIKESSWIEDERDFEEQISVSQKKIARKAVEQLLEAVENPSIHEPITNIISAECDKITPMQYGVKKSNTHLRFAMFDCPSSWSLKMISKVYEKESGGKIAFDFLSYSNLEQVLYKEAKNKSEYYDGIMMDITWLEGIVESGYVLNLDHLKRLNPSYFDGFIDGILKGYGMYVESLYAFPFVSGAQILFYQKDLFEEPAIKRKFKRLYGGELEPPKTWAQFNMVAEFFTKSINPTSPVKYGAALVGGENVFTAISFLNRLWSYESSVFDDRGNIIINNSNSEVTLKNLINSYKYTSQNTLKSWNEVVDAFKTGEYAMTILYDSDAGDINNYTKSKVAGNIGYDYIPGGTPVLGGWSLGINKYGKNIRETEDFLLWACGNQNAIPLPLLGGSTLRKEYYERTDLDNLEPWKSVVLNSYKQSKKRYMPDIIDESRWKNSIYTNIIPTEIVRAVAGEITEKQALINIEARINEIIKKI